MSIKLEDEDAKVLPVPAGNTAYITDAQMTRLSVILSDFNSVFEEIE